MKKLEKGLTLTEINSSEASSRKKAGKEVIVIAEHTYSLETSGIVRSGSRKLLLDAIRDLMPYAGGIPTEISLKFKAIYGRNVI